MKCRGCQFENPSGTNFCGKCGARLSLFCPQCNSFDPPDFRFCGECGHRLSSDQTSKPRNLSLDEKLTRIQRHLPGGLTQRILSQKDRVEGEQRQVTIMFVGIQGLRFPSQDLDPEENLAITEQVFEIVINCVHDSEGTVNELVGNAVLALFGSPIPLENPPQMAIRSSLAIQREVMRFNEKLGTKKGFPPLLVRIGINTGPVIVRALSSDLRVQLVAVGNTLDMATTMQHLAKPGSIYVTEETFRPAQSIFRFESVDEQRAKGKKKPVKIYRVVGPDTSRTGSDPSAERGLTRFVGRQEELQLLLRCLEQAKAGRGQTVSITAEAGVGKSRLLYEFRKAVANENILFLEGRCLSYGRADPYHPIVDMLKSNFEIRDEDRDPEITEKVKKGLAILGQDNTATLPYLLELLSVKNSGIDNFSMSSAAKTDRILSSILRLALKRSEERPLVLVFEDLHWIDKSSEESAKYLVENISAARILIILTYRPDFVQTWGSRSFHSHMELNRLSNKETTTMVSNILGCDDVSMDLANALLEKTKGIPFFIEEFVRALKDMDIIKRNLSYNLSRDIDSVAIPCTIQEVIMARVDSLPDAAKEVLQAGSVVGREFSYQVDRGGYGITGTGIALASIRSNVRGTYL